MVRLAAPPSSRAFARGCTGSDATAIGVLLLRAWPDSVRLRAHSVLHSRVRAPAHRQPRTTLADDILLMLSEYAGKFVEWLCDNEVGDVTLLPRCCHAAATLLPRCCHAAVILKQH